MTPRVRAFTLVEITLAMGIISVVIVSMLGTMSVGLSTIKDAADDTMHAQLLARLSATARQTPFPQIEALAAAGPFDFDSSGQPTTLSGNARYRATLQAAAGAQDSYPGAPAGSNPAVKTEKITVATMPPGARENPAASSHTSILIPHS